MNSVPTLFHIDFCDYYKIRMTTMDGTKMYLVSDLLRQYNEKHGTNKRFGKYLDNKQTKDLLRKWGDRLQKGQNGKWNIPRVIQYITTPNFNGANQGYIVCEELLHACLMWTDPAFAADVFTVIKEENETLKTQCKELKKRHVPDEDSQQWIYVLAYRINENSSDVDIFSKFRSMKFENDLMRELTKEKLIVLFSIRYLPNGYTFRDDAHEVLESICEKYTGSKQRKNYYTFPLLIWNTMKDQIMNSIQDQLNHLRINLCWRPDLDDMNNK